MLLEFRVSNFRSIRDEQVLSLVASGTDRELCDSNVIKTSIKSVPNALRSVVIYGANGSGKSTVLAALNYMRGVVAESATLFQPGTVFNVQRFKLDKAFEYSPTQFEISFIFQGIRYQYAFAMTQQRITSESLLVYRTAKPTQWFNRQIDSNGESYRYEFSDHLKGTRKLWQDSTRSNALFLSTAAQLNSELLGPIFQYITGSLVYVPAGATFSHDWTTSMLATEDGRKQVKAFLADADISIADIQTVTRKNIRNEIRMQEGQLTQGTPLEIDVVMPIFRHVTANGAADLEFHEESDGTQHLYGLIAPILMVLANGHALLIDELSGSLHTLLVRRLIALFHSKTTNPRGAQLIFTTHDTTLLDRDLFRRDQIWLVEKNTADEATKLFPLSDFSARKQEAWQRGYLDGRYGSVPFFPNETPTLKSV